MKMKKVCFLMLLFYLVAIFSWATVSEYSFISTLGTFTEITGGTVLGTSANDNQCFNAIPLGFSFMYNNALYSTISVATNGFIALGDSVASSNVPISAATGTNNIVAGLSRDIKSRDNGELMYLLSGTAPDRIFTVQWKHYRRVPTTTASDDLTFQIQFQENGNKVVFVYGTFTAATAAAAAAIQVGIRGDSNADFSNRTTTSDWSATNPGTANNATCTLSATVYPPTGLTFTYIAPLPGEPPTAAQNPIPTNGATNVSLAAHLGWSPGSGTIDGYKIYLGTDNPPTNIVNGTTQTALTFDPPDFIYSTTYFWKIVPFNAFGDALDCPVWSFNTLADPTVSTYPYNENFDEMIPPMLPPGWTTINANNDSYTWETYAGSAQTPPNCVRIRYNQSMAMNDWLITPPMQLTGGTSYKIRFAYRAHSNTLPEKLALYWGNTPLADSLHTQLFVNEDINLITYTQAEAIVTPSSNGIYYFGFKGFSDPDMFYLYLDSISINVYIEILNPPANLTAAIDGHNVHLEWTAPAPTRSFLGYKVYRNTNLIATIPFPDTLHYDDINVASGLYSYSVTAYYTSGESVAAGPVLADVDPVILPPINLTAEVVERDVTLHWNNPEGDWFTWSQMVTAHSVGTNSAAVFAVAHRWPQADLTPVAGRALSRIEFVPSFANCVYTIKIWTGGSATDAGTLVHSQVVNTFTVGEWNTVLLTALVPIPSTGDLYYGYECNTQGGFPAGTDDGPAIEGKGNMFYFGGTWTTLTAVEPSFTYNWSIRAFAQYTAPGNANPAALTDMADYHLDLSSLSCKAVQPASPKVITGYKVYRDAALIATIGSAETFSYLDAGLPNATYNYGVSSISSTGESVPSTVQAVVNFQLATEIFADGFEDHPDFATTFIPWTLRDVDNTPTLGIPDVTFPGAGNPMAYTIFNPSATTPPLITLIPHGGSKLAAAFASATVVSNDWMIAPRVHFGTDSAIKFYARSLDASGIPARFRVGVSTLPTIVVQGFSYVTGTNYLEAPGNWTEYVYDLSAYDNQNVYIGIRCVSDSSTAFLVDDFSIHSDGGSIVANNDPSTPALSNVLNPNFPNPFNPETTISYQLADKGPVSIDIFNARGQLVRHLLNETKEAGQHSVVYDGRDNNGNPVASGLYFYKMKTGKFSSTRKMVLMK